LPRPALPRMPMISLWMRVSKMRSETLLCIHIGSGQKQDTRLRKCSSGDNNLAPLDFAFSGKKKHSISMSASV